MIYVAYLVRIMSAIFFAIAAAISSHAAADIAECWVLRLNNDIQQEKVLQLNIQQEKSGYD